MGAFKYLPKMKAGMTTLIKQVGFTPSTLAQHGQY